MPKAVDIATSAASRPRPMTMRPMRGWLWRASIVHQRPSRKTSNQGAEIHWIDVDRHADVSQIAGAITGGNVHENCPAARGACRRSAISFTRKFVLATRMRALRPAAPAIPCTKASASVATSPISPSRYAAVQMAPRPLAFLIAQIQRFGAAKATETTAEYLERNIRSPEFRALLATQWGDYGLPPKESAFALHALVVASYLNGGWFPVGGAGRIARTVEPGIEAAGGAIRVCQEATEILVENGRAVGVKAIDRRGAEPSEVRYRAPVVISDVGAPLTYRAAAAEGRRRRTAHRASARRPRRAQGRRVGGDALCPPDGAGLDSRRQGRELLDQHSARSRRPRPAHRTDARRRAASRLSVVPVGEVGRRQVPHRRDHHHAAARGLRRLARHGDRTSRPRLRRPQGPHFAGAVAHRRARRSGLLRPRDLCRTVDAADRRALYLASGGALLRPAGDARTLSLGGLRRAYAGRRALFDRLGRREPRRHRRPDRRSGGGEPGSGARRLPAHHGRRSPGAETLRRGRHGAAKRRRSAPSSSPRPRSPPRSGAWSSNSTRRSRSFPGNMSSSRSRRSSGATIRSPPRPAGG